MYDIRDVKNGHHDDDDNDNNFVNGISYGVGKVGSRIGREKREKEGELKQASSSFLTYLICLKVKFMIPVLKKYLIGCSGVHLHRARSCLFLFCF